MLPLCIAAFIAISPTVNVHAGSVMVFRPAYGNNQCSISLIRNTETADMTCEAFKALYVKAQTSCNSRPLATDVTR